jgi:C_GCAxxG_C_C family probable redox protein
MLLVVGEHVLGGLGPQAARMATGLSGGLGGTHQEVCGALSGGVLVIGAALGRASLQEDDEPAMALSARFRERFLAELGHTQCAPLRELVRAPGGLDSCAELVRRAALILLELLDEPPS